MILYNSLPSIICPLHFTTLAHLTAMAFHLQKFNFHYILYLISPSFICHPHYPHTFLPVPKMMDNLGRTYIYTFIYIRK